MYKATRNGLRWTATLCGLTAAALQAGETPGTALLVLSKSDRTLSVVDPGSLKVMGRVPSGPDPHEVIASADGKLAFISTYGGGAYNTITTVDLVQQKALPVIDLGALRGPHGLVFSGGKLWFTAEGAKAIGSYDPATSKIDWVLGTGQNGTHMILVSDDGKRVVTSNVGSGTLTFAEKSMRPRGSGRPAGGPRGARPGGLPGGDWDETVVVVGARAEGFDASPDGKEIWAANAQDGTVSVVDVASKKVTETLKANVRGANRLKFTPDGKMVFVSTLDGPDVVVFDSATRRERKRVKVGRGAAGILMQPDGKRVFVACTPDNYVAVIDLQSLAVVNHIDAGKEPDGLAWAVRR